MWQVSEPPWKKKNNSFSVYSIYQQQNTEKEIDHVHVSISINLTKVVVKHFDNENFKPGKIEVKKATWKWKDISVSWVVINSILKGTIFQKVNSVYSQWKSMSYSSQI